MTMALLVLDIGDDDGSCVVSGKLARLEDDDGSCAVSGKLARLGDDDGSCAVSGKLARLDDGSRGLARRWLAPPVIMATVKLILN